MFTKYIGVGKQQVVTFKKKNSRWISIIKNYPGIFASERELGLLDPHDDEEDEKEVALAPPKAWLFYNSYTQLS